MKQNSKNSTINEMVNNIKDINELKEFQKSLNEACDKRMTILNVKDEAANLEIPSYFFIKESFENMAQYLVKNQKGKKIIAKYIKEHKNNKELNKLFHIYENLSKADKTINVIRLVESMKSLVGDINETKLNDGIEKLKDILRESYIAVGVEAKNLLSENKNPDLHNNVNYVFTNSLKMSNMVTYNRCINEIKKYVESNDIRENKISFTKNSSLEECFSKYDNFFSEENLSEEGMKIINEIRESENKEEVYAKYKAECLKALENRLVNEAHQETYNKLTEFKNKIINKEYNSDSLGTDIANFIELKELVSE